MNLMKKLTFTFALACLLAFTACSDYVGKENSHPLFTRAMTCKSNKNYVDSVKAFEEFLAICPRSALTHKELAEVYGDYLGDYVRAIYHYEKYTELGRLSNMDKQDIRKMINANKRKFYDKYKEENNIQDEVIAPPVIVNPEINPAKFNAMKKKNEILTEKFKEYYEANQKLSEENKVLRERLEQAVAAAVSTKTRASGKTTVNNQKPAAASGINAEKQSSSTGDTYVVKSGDTLMKIAKKAYGSGTHYKLILEANKDKIGENGNKLSIGQTLVLPPIPVQ